MPMKFVPGTKIVRWDEDPQVTELKRASAESWRAYQERLADNWRRNVQAGKAAPAARQRVGGHEVKRPMSEEEKVMRTLIGKLVLRLSEILTPAESKQVKVSIVSTRYPLIAPPAIEQKIYTDPVAQLLLTQLGRKLAEAEQAAAFKITIT